jgi:hypothetical protein
LRAKLKAVDVRASVNDCVMYAVARALARWRRTAVRKETLTPAHTIPFARRWSFLEDFFRAL